MCRRVLALYDLCHDTPSRPSTCSSSRPVNSPHNDVYFGLQRCSSGADTTPCPESNYYPTIYLPLVARTCSNACERELNPEYWSERQRMRRKEYNPFLDRMLVLGRDARLYHVVTGECVADEEQFGDDPPTERQAYVGMLPAVPWDGSSRVEGRAAVRREGEGVTWAPASGGPASAALSSPSATAGPSRQGTSGSELRSGGGQETASQLSRTSTWLDYRSHLRSLRGRINDRNDTRGDQDTSATTPGGRYYSPSWLGRRVLRTKGSKRCLVSHET